MIDYDSFRKGQYVVLKVYKTDEYNGDVQTRKVKGVVHQITRDFVSIKKEKTNLIESFKYCELNSENIVQPVKLPYDEEGEYYKEDIVKDCIKSLNKDEEGIVFNQSQLNQVISKVKKDIKVINKNGIYKLK